MPLLSFVVGLAVICSGLTSIATKPQVFAVNLGALLGIEFLPVWAITIGFLLILAGLVLRGISTSSCDPASRRPSPIDPVKAPQRG